MRKEYMKPQSVIEAERERASSKMGSHAPNRVAQREGRRRWGRSEYMKPGSHAPNGIAQGLVVAAAGIAVAAAGLFLLMRLSPVPLQGLVLSLPFGGSVPKSSPSPASSDIRVGHEAFMTQGLMFVSESAVNEALHSGGNDIATRKKALIAMMMGGQVIGVGDNWTRVMVLGHSSGVYRVRVLEGEMIGRVGFVPGTSLASKD